MKPRRPNGCLNCQYLASLDNDDMYFCTEFRQHHNPSSPNTKGFVRVNKRPNGSGNAGLDRNLSYAINNYAIYPVSIRKASKLRLIDKSFADWVLKVAKDEKSSN